jgi:ketosteroid isomerase-like protein
MKSLADTERAFASMSVQQGVRMAFLANFADDGIAFQPHPVVYKDAAKDRPAPANPNAFTLNWKPVFGDVSESGNLGYTTGPYSFVDNSGKQPPSHGFYFSVWKKDSTSRWRVAVDIGIGTPGPFEGPEDFRQAQPSKKSQSMPGEGKSGKQELEESIGEYLSIAAADGVIAAYENHLVEECRLHLEGHHPLLGRRFVTAFFDGKEITRTGKLLLAAVSESDDLGYAYGSYANLERGRSIENGYFCHVWKRNELGLWKLAAEILSPVPPEAP